MTRDPEGICIVIPPSVFLLDERVFISLGPLKVAAALLREGYLVEVLDLSGISNFEEALRHHVRAKHCWAYGLTATTPQLPAARTLIRAIREENPKAKIILGGPHTTLTLAARRREISRGHRGRAHAAQDVLEGLADVLVAGDGEEAIFHALKEDSPKIIDADSQRSPLFLSSRKLEEAPWPARQLVDLSTYRYEIEGQRATSLIAQLGCPFSCGFCGGRFSPSLRNIRTRSSESIVAEMLHLYHTYGYRGFMLYDDELNVNKEIIELMRQIQRAQESTGESWTLRGFVKAELFTREQAEALFSWFRTTVIFWKRRP
jgi:radical SAM superfamily enzyme YgiQ (UPF0313 family)